MASSRLVQDYRKLLRHFKILPSPTQQSIFRQLVNRVRTLSLSLLDLSLSLFLCISLSLWFSLYQLRNSPEDFERNARVLRSYVALTSSISELNYLRSLDTGEKMTQRSCTHFSTVLCDFLFSCSRIAFLSLCRERIQASAQKVGLGVPQVIISFCLHCTVSHSFF